MQDEELQKFDHDIKSLIEDYVEKQDLSLLQTPLKTNNQLKDELRDKMQQAFSFAALNRGIFNAVDLMTNHLMAFGSVNQLEAIREELGNAFINFAELQKKHQDDVDYEWLNQLDPEVPVWTSLYGISSSTLLLIYGIALKCLENREVSNAKDLLELILIFAPSVSSYWNAMGYCYQLEENYDRAIHYFLISQEIEPELPETYFYLINAYKRTGQKSLALDQLNQLQQKIPQEDLLKWQAVIQELNKEIS